MRTAVFFKLFLAALSLCVLAPALSIDAEAGFFVASGETMALSNFSSDGTAYTMLKINGVPSVVFKSTDGGFSPVTDDAQVAVLVPAFLRTQALPFDAATLSSVRSNYDYVNGEVGTCVEGVNVFYGCRTPPPFPCAYMWITILPEDPQSLAEVRKMDPVFPVLQQGMGGLTSAMSSLESAFAENDLDASATAAATMYDSVAAIQANYNTIAAAVSVIRPNYFYAFDYWNQTSSTPVKANCTSTVSLSNALNSLSTFAASTKALSTGDALDSIKSTTAARNASAGAKRIHYFKAEAFRPLSQDARKVLLEFGSAGLVVTGFSNQLSGATTALELIRNATTVSDAEARASDFDSKEAALEAKTALYESLFPEYNASVVMQSNASSQIQKASKRYGANSEFVVPLQKQYSATKLSLKAVQDKLSAGQDASLADLKKITANYTQLVDSASGLKSRESQVDWVIVGGVAVVVIAILAAILYFRKFKPSLPSLKGKKEEKVIDVRRLPPSQQGGQPPAEGPPWMKR
ncbi:MAG: hypothetical protein NTY90_03935 [Candidatus Micrarchaeota archaeon]|nr:hypothetical protein [Candidatus Micrarchaeota archaeon]